MRELILFDYNIDNSIIKIFSKSSKLFLLKNNIYDLNKFKHLNNLYMFEDNFKSFDIFSSLLKKQSIEIIINTNYPYVAKKIEQLNFNELKKNLNINLIPIFYFIKNLILMKKKIFITIFLHEFKKKYFLLENQIYNQIYVSFINSFSSEIRLLKKDIYINFIITNNLNLDYKKSIYPYKNIAYKDLDALENLYFYILKKKFKNKIFSI